MKSVKLLLDMGAAKCGSDAELARRIGDSRQNINAMRRGTRAISPETAATICDVLELPGEEAREWIALAVIENPKNASRVELLKRALFACWVLGGASLVTLFSAAVLSLGTVRSAVAQTAATTEAVTGAKLTVYTLSRIVLALVLALGLVLPACRLGFALMARGIHRTITRPAPVTIFPTA